MSNSMFTELYSYVLVRGQNSDLSPLKALKDFQHYELMKKGMKAAGVKDEASLLQKYAWKHILDKRNCILIGTKEVLLTRLAYLVPITAEVLIESSNSNLSGSGPMALIITSSVASGKEIEVSLKHLIDDQDMYKHYWDLDYGTPRLRRPKRDWEFNNPFAKDVLPKKQINIVVCTPEEALSLVNDGSLVFDRLMYLVFDDAEILLKLKQKQSLEILRLICHFMKTLKDRPIPFQIIYCGKKWTSELEAAFDYSCDDPILIIRNAFQILVYSQIRIQAHLMTTVNKIPYLIELLKNEAKVKYSSTIIISSDNESCKSIQKALKRHRIPSKFIDSEEETSHTDLEALKNAEYENREIIICSDDIARLLTLKKIERIIHFDMPKSSFAERYYLMWDHIRDISARTCFQNKEIISHVFLTYDDENVDKMVEQLNKANANIPKLLKDFAKKVKRDREETNDLCLSLKEFGECRQNESCLLRHFFIESELNETHIPQTGEIIVKIVKSHNPSRHTAIIQKHSFIHDKQRQPWVSYTEKMESLRKDLDEFYDNEINREFPDTYPEGLIVAFKDNDGFVRGKILKIASTSHNGFVESVSCYCIDTGKDNFIVDVLKIYCLPEKFASLPHLAIEIILEGMNPAFGANQHSGRLITNDAIIYAEDRIAIGKILLVAGNTVWVNPLKELEKPRNVVGRNFKEKFIQDRMAVKNPNHIKKLYKLCKKIVPNLPQFLTPEEPEPLEIPESKDTEDWSDSDTNITAAVEENDIETNYLPNFEDNMAMEEEECDEDEIFEVSGKNELARHFGLVPWIEIANSLPGSVNEDRQRELLENPRRFNTNSNSHERVEQENSVVTDTDATFNFKSCQVEWSLTLEEVNLKVLVPEIIKYEINFSDDKRVLSFITLDPPEFGFNLELYGKVKVNDIKVHPYGRYTMIKLIKRAAAKWPRITLAERNYNWLKQNMDSYCATIAEAEENEEYSTIIIENGQGDESDDYDSDEEEKIVSIVNELTLDDK